MSGEKRTRESASKSRNGCVTCKARRVKCDEGKPFCQRCQTSGRTCDGYSSRQAVVPNLNSIVFYQAPLSLSRPLPNAISSQYEFSNVDFYYQRVAARLSGRFDSDFWTTLVMQLSRSDPAVRHAVNAISLAVRNSSAGALTENGEDPRVLRECNEAIRCVSKQMESNPSSRLVPLVICLLFTCLEFIHGTVDGALAHARGGFKMLQYGHQFAEDAQERHTITKCIEPLFERLDVLCKLFGKILYPRNAILKSFQSPFRKLQDVQASLVEILSAAVIFIHISGAKTHAGTAQLEDVLDQHRLQQRMDSWEEKLEMFLAKRSREELNDMRDSLCILQMQYKAIKIWLSICLSIEECSSDLYNEEYASIVQMGKEVICNQTINTQAKQDGVLGSDDISITFEMQVIAPLYLTAVKCRLPSLRRQAIQLLRQGPRREGLWDAHIACRVAETVIEIEEENLRRIYGDRVDLDDMLPPENDRIFFIKELPAIFDSDRERKFEQTFSQKPNGINGDWNYITKEIVL